MYQRELKVCSILEVRESWQRVYHVTETVQALVDTSFGY